MAVSPIFISASLHNYCTVELILSTMYHCGRWFRRTPKVLAAARIDRQVYDWLLPFGAGYSTRINSILRAVMERAQ